MTDSTNTQNATVVLVQGRGFARDRAQSAGLVMTATLAPPKQAVGRADPVDRLNDYLEALKFYLSLPDSTIDRILFVDNSNGDLAPLVQLAKAVDHGKLVEFIAFEGNDHPFQRGKAYGEFKLLDFGLANTSLFRPEDRVWKTTGRLKFLNLPQMASRCKDLSIDVLGDLHNVPWVGSGNWQTRHNMDLRVFAFRMGAYDTVFRGLWQGRDSGFDAGFMYHHVLAMQKSCALIPRFPLQPLLQGISGRHQRDYLSPSQRAKDGVRRLARRIMPWLWL